MNENSPYKTEKLILAAYLIAAGKCELIGTEPTPGSRMVTFVLSKQPSDEDVSAFFTGSAVISALRYAESINSCKGVAYEARKRSQQA
ncbi:MAG: hypothetical protein ABII79_11270 [bacterium]